MHRDATHRSLIGKPTPRTDARPGLAVILATHDALTHCANNNGYVFHDPSDDLNNLNGFNGLNALNVDSMHIPAARSRYRLGPKNRVQPIQIFFG
jgi:hypothetical protein